MKTYLKLIAVISVSIALTVIYYNADFKVGLYKKEVVIDDCPTGIDLDKLDLNQIEHVTKKYIYIERKDKGLIQKRIASVISKRDVNQHTVIINYGATARGLTPSVGYYKNFFSLFSKDVSIGIMLGGGNASAGVMVSF